METSCFVTTDFFHKLFLHRVTQEGIVCPRYTNDVSAIHAMISRYPINISAPSQYPRRNKITILERIPPLTTCSFLFARCVSFVSCKIDGTRNSGNKLYSVSEIFPKWCFGKIRIKFYQRQMGMGERELIIRGKIYIFKSSNQIKLIIKSSLFRLTRRKRKKNESKIISSNQNDVKIAEHR